MRKYDRLSSISRLKTVEPACKSDGFLVSLIGVCCRTPFLCRHREAPGSGRNLLPGAFTFTRRRADKEQKGAGADKVSPAPVYDGEGSQLVISQAEKRGSRVPVNLRVRRMPKN